MRFANLDDRMVLVDGGGAVDVAGASRGRFGPDPMDALARWDEFTEWAAGFPVPGSDADHLPADPRRFGPPVPRPRQVFALALNYRPHAAEVGFQPPAEPLVFTKFLTCLTGPCPMVELPSDRVDWETELVVVIGRGGHRIREEVAWSHVAGLTAGQDLTERNLQAAGRPAQFSLSKSFPGFGATGPVLVSLDELTDPDDLELSSVLNGQVVQHARTSEMIFSVPDLIARLSAVCPLLPGDLVFTGTPGGIGARMDPPRYLRADDVLVSRLEGIGELRTTFTAPPTG